MAKKYPITSAYKEELRIRFTYHAPKNDQPERYELLRNAALALASMVSQHCPQSFEREKALTCIETAVFWANAAIARRE
jgi:hypothetical protein